MNDKQHPTATSVSGQDRADADRRNAESRRGFMRDLLVGGTAAATAAGSPGSALAQQTQAAAPAAAGKAAADVPAGYLFLQPTEAAFVESLVDHIYPADERSPGGVDIGLATYIDRALGGPWGAGDRLYMDGPWETGVPQQGYQLPLSPAQLVRQGIQSTNSACARQYGGKAFDGLSAGDKEAVLQQLFSGKLVFDNGLPSATFFSVLYQCVVEGIFSDPIYGGNKDKAGWKLVGFPGVVATHANDIDTYRNKPYPVKYLGIADMA